MNSLGPYLFIAAALVLMLIAASRSQPVRPGRMWIVPAFGLFSLIVNLSHGPAPNAIAFAIFAVALVAGGAAGWLRALHTQLSIDPATGEVTSKPTLIGALLIVGFVVLRTVLDTLSGQPPGAAAVAVRTTDLLRLADAGLIFSLAMIIVRRLVIWRRAAALTATRAVTAGPPPHV
jgi:hypothetical protein